MILKIFGCLLIITGCGIFGSLIAASYRRETSTLQQLLKALEYISCELQCRRTPLPELSQQASALSTGPISQFFYTLSMNLNRQIVPDARKCVDDILKEMDKIPDLTREELHELGYTLGIFDLEGQLNTLAISCDRIKEKLDHRMQEQNTRLRSYQTLALCAGAAISILLI